MTKRIEFSDQFVKYNWQVKYSCLLVTCDGKRWIFSV